MNEQRYMMYAPGLGILISNAGGQPAFSQGAIVVQMLSGSSEMSAPTYDRESALKLKESPGFAGLGVNLMGVAVLPDLPGDRASMLACCRAWMKAEQLHEVEGAFPGWNELTLYNAPEVLA